MAETPEGRVKRKALALYKKYGAKYDRAAQTGMGRNGRPDDLVRRSPDGHFIAVEFKKLDVCRVTKLQQIWLDECAAGGGSSLVINAENLGLLEKSLATPGAVVRALFEPAKDGAICVAHLVRPVAGSSLVIHMNGSLKKEAAE